MSGKSKFLIFIVLLVGAYVAAWLPARYQSEEREKKFSEEREALQTEFDRMREDLANTQDRLQAAGLGSRLALMIINVEQKNLGQAREQASTFFQRPPGSGLLGRGREDATAPQEKGWRE